MTVQADPVYHHGRSPEETQRLIDQAAIYEGNTRRMLEEAGISRGMKVLDVGSGAGDVALLAARLVGPDGSVVGIDQNPEVLDTARERAQAAGFANVTFVEGDVRTADLPRDFDAAVGRLVLMYTADPEAALKTIVERVRRGGVVAFQEFDVSLWNVDPQSLPVLARFVQLGADAVGGWGGVHVTFGQRLHSAFIAAGLEAPAMWGFIPMGGAAGWPGYSLLQSSFRTMLPVIEQSGLAKAADLDIDTLQERLHADVVRSGLPLSGPPHVTAWARKA